MRTRSRILSFAIVANRLFLGAIFLTGGMSKLIPFPGVMGPVWLEPRGGRRHHSVNL